MPPHCDSLDGPVVRAAREALEWEDQERILAYVPAEAEAELRAAFEMVMKARTQGFEAKAVAERYFYETAVRLHRAGEGAPFTGLKPAGLDVGPVIPIAERAITREDPTRLIEILVETLQGEIVDRFAVAMKRKHEIRDLADERSYVSAMLALQVWAHKVHGCMTQQTHEHGA